ncbi:MAG TPA: 1,4-alpha-glucan branching protein [Streptosporangiaceae bacterium]|nr:1,4-alpha-glucan branching protein [Streptosporangiaceae bacterium]
MAVIHHTTLTPTKLELLAAWLPAQPWYPGPGQPTALARAGGFRLDDPAGEVGIEFMVVTDNADGASVSYHVPLTYRGAPLAGAHDALIGQAEHGVLGRRWIYDGVHDPVLMAQLSELLRGGVQAQAQSVSDTADPTVVACFTGTDLSEADLRIVRRPEPSRGDVPDPGGTVGYVEATWHPPAGSAVRGRLVLVPDTALEN